MNIIKKTKRGENVKKQIMMLIMTLSFIMVISGAVSATDTYDIGVNVTEQAMADNNLGLNTSESNLVITTGSTSHLDDGSTTEDSVSAIVNTTSSLADGQAITYGSGNLLIVNDPNGLLTYTFVSLASNGALRAQKYIVTGTSTSYSISHGSSVYIGANMTQEQWNYALQELGENAYNLIAIANLWAAGAPADLMATTYNTGTIDASIMSNYAVLKQYLQNYPSGTSYLFVTPGGLDDDTIFFDVFTGSFKVYAMNGGDPTKIGLMQYDSTSKTGFLLLMQENNLTSQFKAETGISFVEGTLSEIQYNLWLFNLLKTNPAALYTVLEMKTIDEAAYNYLWYDSNLGYGHGLVEDFIAGLPDLSTTYDQSQGVIPPVNINEMQELGKEILDEAQNALGYTSSEEFVADMKNGKIGVLVAPYYVNFNGMSILGLLDGINYYGALTISTLMTNWHSWNHGTGGFKVIFFRLDSIDLQNAVNTVITRILVTATPNGDDYTLSTAEGNGPGYIKILSLAYAQGASWDLIRSVRRGCMKTEQMYDASLYGMNEYPLGPNEQYMVIELTPEMRAFMFRTALFGVSLGTGTYFTTGMATIYENAVYILIKWNYITKTGVAALIQYNMDATEAMIARDGYSDVDEWNLNWHLVTVFKDSSYLTAMFNVVREIPLNSDILNELIAAGGDPVDYILNYVIPKPHQTTTDTAHTGTALTALNEALPNAWNDLTSSTPTNEIVPELPLGQSTPVTDVTNSSNAGQPIGTIIGIIFLIIVTMLVYIRRNTIATTLRGYGRPGK
jgi:formylmethanofuran dehydrogenase subunit E-like metal-binding protein